MEVNCNLTSVETTVETFYMNVEATAYDKGSDVTEHEKETHSMLEPVEETPDIINKSEENGDLEQQEQDTPSDPSDCELQDEKIHENGKQEIEEIYKNVEPETKQVDEIVEPISEEIHETKESEFKKFQENVEPIEEEIPENVEPVIEEMHENIDPESEEINEVEEPEYGNIEPGIEEINETKEPEFEKIQENDDDPVTEEIQENDEPVMEEIYETKEPEFEKIQETDEPLMEEIHENTEPEYEKIHENVEPIMEEIHENIKQEYEQLDTNIELETEEIQENMKQEYENIQDKVEEIESVQITPDIGFKSEVGIDQQEQLGYFVATAPSDAAKTTCELCNKVFCSGQKLRQHMMLHTGEKPFACDLCDKRFHRKDKLKAHHKSHTEEAPKLHCDLCDRTFSHVGNFNSHRKKHIKKGELSGGADMEFAPKLNDLKINSILMNLQPVNPLENDFNVENGDLNPPFLISDITQSDEQQERNEELSGINSSEKQNPSTVVITKMNDNNSPITFQDENSMVENDNSHESTPHIDLPSQDMNGQSENDEDTDEHSSPFEVTPDIFIPPTEWGREQEQDLSNIIIDGTAKTCPFCNKSYVSNQKLRHHMMVHTGERPWVCTICSKGFTRKDKLKEHFRIHTGERPYTCDICNKSFSHASHLISHKKIHAGIKLYSCDICDKSFLENSYLTKHKRTHTGEKPYSCDVCDKVFLTSSSASKHKKSAVHFKVLREKMMNLNTQNNLADLVNNADINVKQEHMGDNSNEETPFVDVKGEPVENSHSNHSLGQNREALNSQLNGESLNRGGKTAVNSVPEPPPTFSCTICDEKFAFKYKLKQHRKIHSGEKPFSCDLCGESFAHKNNLSVHSRKVHGIFEKNHKCDICGKMFARNGHLLVHYNIHTGAKPYSCDICQKSFHADAGLAKHNKSYWHLEMVKYITGETTVNPSELENAFTRRKKKKSEENNDDENGPKKKRRRKKKVAKVDESDTNEYEDSSYLFNHYDDALETDWPPPTTNSTNDQNMAIKYEEFEEEYDNLHDDTEGINGVECNVEIKEETTTEMLS